IEHMPSCGNWPILLRTAGGWRVPTLTLSNRDTAYLGHGGPRSLRPQRRVHRACRIASPFWRSHLFPQTSLFGSQKERRGIVAGPATHRRSQAPRRPCLRDGRFRRGGDRGAGLLERGADVDGAVTAPTAPAPSWQLRQLFGG